MSSELIRRLKRITDNPYCRPEVASQVINLITDIEFGTIILGDPDPIEPTATLTDRQVSVFNMMLRFHRREGYGPTVREIGDECSIGNPNGVICHLKALQKKGLIRRVPGSSRAIHFLRTTPFPEVQPA